MTTSKISNIYYSHKTDVMSKYAPTTTSNTPLIYL